MIVPAAGYRRIGGFSPLFTGAGAVRMEPLRFYLDLMAYPVKRRRTLRSWLLACCLILSQVSNAAGFFAARETGKQSRTAETVP